MAVEKEIKVPDIGGASNVDVIEILVQIGDTIDIDTPLITLESDKASMEIPSSSAGIVQAIKVKLGDKLSEGDAILTVKTDENTTPESTSEKKIDSTTTKEPAEKMPVVEEEKKTAAIEAPVKSAQETPISDEDAALIAAGPSARRLAFTLGVNLSDVMGSGRKSRISTEDIEQYVKQKLNAQTTASGLSVAAAPQIDFSKFGAIESKPLNKIKRLTGANVHRSWVTVPHVTQFDDADITDLESFRKSEMAKLQNSDIKLTLLAFVCKVVSKALQVFPQFNASLDAKGENLIYKQYYHIGIAVETPNGLVVPVIKDVDQRTVGEIAKEMSRLSSKARDKGLMPNDMNGGTFTISSLGGIGGRAFTPIVNSPEVAILGLSRSSIQPVYQNGEFVPRLMLPLSLSYDHRVIDGAEAARFTRYLSESLSDIRRILI